MKKGSKEQQNKIPTMAFARTTNKARRSKESILVDVKMLLKTYLPAYQRMPKIERIEGAPREMKNAAFSIIEYFTIAYECEEARRENIQKMLGAVGKMLACFELMVAQGYLPTKTQYEIAGRLSKIEEGAKKWKNALRTSNQMADAREGQAQEQILTILRAKEFRDSPGRG